MLIVFAAGYVLGSRASAQSLDEVVKALRAVRESEEFHGLVVAVRSHAADSLRSLAGLLDGWDDVGTKPGVPSDLLERVRLITGRR